MKRKGNENVKGQETLNCEMEFRDEKMKGVVLWAEYFFHVVLDEV